MPKFNWRLATDLAQTRMAAGIVLTATVLGFGAAGLEIARQRMQIARTEIMRQHLAIEVEKHNKDLAGILDIKMTPDGTLQRSNYDWDASLPWGGKSYPVRIAARAIVTGGPNGKPINKSCVAGDKPGGMVRIAFSFQQTGLLAAQPQKKIFEYTHCVPTG